MVTLASTVRSPRALLEVDARAGGVEARVRAFLADERGRAAGRRHDEDAGLLAVVRPAHVVALDGAIDDALAVRRERRLDVVPGRRHHLAAAAAVGADDADAPAIDVAPRRVDDRASVGRERRRVLEIVARRQPLRRPRRQRPDPQLAERAVDDALPVRRDHRAAQHADGEAIGRHHHREADRFRDPLLDLGDERDLAAGLQRRARRGRRRRQIDPPDLPLRPTPPAPWSRAATRTGCRGRRSSRPPAGPCPGARRSAARRRSRRCGRTTGCRSRCGGRTPATCRRARRAA